MESWLIVGLTVWIVLMSGLLVWFRDYKECAIGGLGLFIIIISNVATLRDMLYGVEYYNYLPVTIGTFIGIALVLTQHALGHFKHWYREGRKTGQKLFY